MPTENDTDRITNLAEELKCHILSFLPTKDAIRTSALSSRWRTLWTLVPVVYFQNDEELPNERFLRCVKSTVTRRDGQPIKKFSLRSDFEDRDWLELEACTNAALNCKVEHLELSNFHLFPPSLLPPSVLTCPTIVVLELMKFLISPSSITSPVNLPKLKTLYLYFNTFTSDDIVNFFCGCPVLEHLSMYDTGVYPNDVDGGSPRHCPERQINLPNLVEAKTTIELFARSHNLLKALCNIKRLTLYIEFWTSDMMQSISNNIPTFPNLTHLGFYSYNYRWDILAMMLHSSPKLESLSLWKFMCICHASGNTSLEPPQHIPRCVSVHLKEVCFTRCEGKQIELEIARYILENATVLRKMTICWCSDLDAETRLNVTAKLSTFLRSSLTCKLIFS